MLILAVDLAAKYSAACLMDGQDQVVDQFDSWQLSQNLFLHQVTACAQQRKPAAVVVEDLPHGLAYTTVVKTVCRIQGRMIDKFARHDSEDDLLFLAPATWRHHYAGLKRGTGPTAVVPVAAQHGYTPPDLSLRALREKGGKAIARKVATDYCSAYLIARWAHDIHAELGTLDVVGTSRWNTPVIRKKDLDA